MNVIERLKKLKPNKNLDIFDTDGLNRSAVAQMNFESTAMMHSGVPEAMVNMTNTQDVNRFHLFHDLESRGLYRYNINENRWDKV